MAFSDKLKDLRSKAEGAVVDRKDQINSAVQKAGEVADQRTGGRYSEQIQAAGGRASGLIDGLAGADAEAPGEPAREPAAGTDQAAGPATKESTGA